VNTPVAFVGSGVTLAYDTADAEAHPLFYVGQAGIGFQQETICQLQKLFAQITRPGLALRRQAFAQAPSRAADAGRRDCRYTRDRGGTFRQPSIRGSGRT